MENERFEFRLSAGRRRERAEDGLALLGGGTLGPQLFPPHQITTLARERARLPAG